MNMIDMPGLEALDNKTFQLHIQERVNAVLFGSVPKYFPSIQLQLNISAAENTIYETPIHTAIIVFNPIGEKAKPQASILIDMADAIYNRSNDFEVVFVITHQHTEETNKKNISSEIQSMIKQQFKNATICNIEMGEHYDKGEMHTAAMNIINAVRKVANQNFKCFYPHKGMALAKPTKYTVSPQIQQMQQQRKQVLDTITATSSTSNGPVDSELLLIDGNALDQNNNVNDNAQEEAATGSIVSKFVQHGVRALWK